MFESIKNLRKKMKRNKILIKYKMTISIHILVRLQTSHTMKLSNGDYKLYI